MPTAPVPLPDRALRLTFAQEVALELAITIGVFMGLATLLGLAALPWGARQLPADFFTHTPAPFRERLRARPARVVLQNLLGAAVMALGIALLVLPGQGLLTLLVGILLTDLPVRDRILRWIALRRPVAKALQSIRTSADLPPFEGLDAQKPLANE